MVYLVLKEDKRRRNENAAGSPNEAGRQGAHDRVPEDFVQAFDQSAKLYSGLNVGIKISLFAADIDTISKRNSKAGLTGGHIKCEFKILISKTCATFF